MLAGLCLVAGALLPQAAPAADPGQDANAALDRKKHEIDLVRDQLNEAGRKFKQHHLTEPKFVSPTRYPANWGSLTGPQRQEWDRQWVAAYDKARKAHDAEYARWIAVKLGLSANMAKINRDLSRLQDEWNRLPRGAPNAPTPAPANVPNPLEQDAQAARQAPASGPLNPLEQAALTAAKPQPTGPANPLEPATPATDDSANPFGQAAAQSASDAENPLEREARLQAEAKALAVKIREGDLAKQELVALKAKADRKTALPDLERQIQEARAAMDEHARTAPRQPFHFRLTHGSLSKEEQDEADRQQRIRDQEEMATWRSAVAEWQKTHQPYVDKVRELETKRDRIQKE